MRARLESAARAGRLAARSGDERWHGRRRRRGARFKDFTGNAPLGFEVYNTGVVPLDLSGSWFEDPLPDGGSLPASSRVFRPMNANLSNLGTGPVAGAGPKPCADQAACAPLGGAQRCHHGQCLPQCLLVPCTALQSCNPSSGACE